MDELDDLISLVNDDSSSEKSGEKRERLASNEVFQGDLLSQILDNKNLTAETKLEYIMDELQNNSFGCSDQDINIALQRKGWNNLKVDDIKRECKHIARSMKDMSEEWYQCSLCEQSYPADKYHCTSCGEEFVNLLDLQIHVSEFHVSIGGKDEQVCNSCGINFGTSKKSLQKHMYEKHICSQGHVECPVGCKVLIPAESENSIKVSRHISSKHVCEFCGEKTLFLYRHFVVFHAMRDDDVSSQGSITGRHDTPGSKAVSVAKEEMKALHPVRNMSHDTFQARQKDENNDHVVCNFCRLSTPLNGFSCPVCSENFDYYADSLVHLVNDHQYSIDSEIGCEICQKPLLLHELKGHIQRQHFCYSSHLRCPRNCLVLFGNETDVMNHLQVEHNSVPLVRAPPVVQAPIVNKLKNAGILETPHSPGALLPQKLSEVFFAKSNSLNNMNHLQAREMWTPKNPLIEGKPYQMQSLPVLNSAIIQIDTTSFKHTGNIKSFAEWEEWIEENGPVSLGLPGYMVYLSPLPRQIDPKRSNKAEDSMECSVCRFKYPKQLLECNLCNMRFCTKGSFYFHNETMHSIVGENMICSCCQKPWPSVNVMMSHELYNACKLHFECPFNCNDLLNSKKGLQEHLLSEHKAVAAPNTSNMLPFGLSTYGKSIGISGVPCLKCGLVCYKKERWSQCTLCDKHKTPIVYTFVNGLEFLTHLCRHHKLKLPIYLTCPSCGMISPNVGQFQRHQLSMHGYCSFHQPCSNKQCNVIFPNGSDLMKNHVSKCEFNKRKVKATPTHPQGSTQPSTIEPFSMTKPNVEKEVLIKASVSANSTTQRGVLPLPIQSTVAPKQQNANTSYPIANFPSLESLPVMQNMKDPVQLYRKSVSNSSANSFARTILNHPTNVNPPLSSVELGNEALLSQAYQPVLEFEENPNAMTYDLQTNSDMEIEDVDVTPAKGPPKGEAPSSVDLRKTSCRNCYFGYHPEKLSREHYCLDCNLNFHRVFDLHFHLMLAHQQEVNVSNKYYCELCGERTKRFDTSDLLSHRVEQHGICLVHVMCSNSGCETLWGDIKDMKKHSEGSCPYKSANNLQTTNSSLPRKRQKPPTELTLQTPSAKRRSHAGQLVAFRETQNLFITHNIKEDNFPGCDDCGKVKPSTKLYECRLCNKEVRRSEKQFLLYLEALMHLIEDHGFEVTGAKKMCQNSGCLDNAGMALEFIKIEDYYKHGVEKHKVCPRHFVCPRGCLAVFNNTKKVGIHVSKCQFSKSKKKEQTSF